MKYRVKAKATEELVYDLDLDIPLIGQEAATTLLDKALWRSANDDDISDIVKDAVATVSERRIRVVEVWRGEHRVYPRLRAPSTGDGDELAA
jgi:hypothetical protein